MFSARDARFLFVLALSLILNVCAVWWGLPSFHGWAPDEIPPSVIQEGLEVRFSGDWTQPNYPPFHYYLLGLVHLPVVALDALGLVDVRALPTYSFLFYLHRLLSLFMATAVLFMVYRISVEVFADEKAASWAAWVAALSAPFVYYSKTANLEIPVTFWFMVSMFFFLRMVKEHRLRDYLLFTAAAVAAICTKDQAFAFYVLPLSFLVVRRWREQENMGGGSAAARVLLDRRMVLSGITAVLLFFAFHNVIFNYRGFVHHLEGIFWARGHYSQFGGTLADHVKMTWDSARHVKFSMGWPLAVGSLLGVLGALKHWRKQPLPLWILAAGASYYIFFVAPVLSNYVRYLVPICVVLALFAGRFLSRFTDPRKAMYGARRALVSIVFVYSLLYAASVDVLMLNDSRYMVEDWLAENVPEKAVVGYMGPEYYLPRLIPYDAKRLRPTESVLNRESPDYLVINSDFFQRFDPATREGKLFHRLRAGRTGYALVLRYKWPAEGVLLRTEDILSNLEKINPRIEVYQRAD